MWPESGNQSESDGLDESRLSPSSARASEVARSWSSDARSSSAPSTCPPDSRAACKARFRVVMLVHACATASAKRLTRGCYLADRVGDAEDEQVVTGSPPAAPDVLDRLVASAAAFGDRARLHVVEDPKIGPRTPAARSHQATLSARSRSRRACRSCIAVPARAAVAPIAALSSERATVLQADTTARV